MSWFKWPFRAARQAGDPTARAEAVTAQLRALARPCLRLSPGGTGKSRLGGVPDLRSAWPRYDGRPLSCVAQLDLSEMRAAGGVDWLPGEGRLTFFYELEHGSWGLEPEDFGSSVVVYETGGAEPAAEPADLPEHARAPAYPIRFTAATSLPSTERLDIDWKRMSKAESLAVEAAAEALEPPSPVHQVGGFPRAVQADQMELQCEVVSEALRPSGGRGLVTGEPAPSAVAQWRLLLQVDSDDDAGMMWGDTGTLYFWIREQDARAGDFSKTWTILQCC